MRAMLRPSGPSWSKRRVTRLRWRLSPGFGGGGGGAPATAAPRLGVLEGLPDRPRVEEAEVARLLPHAVLVDLDLLRPEVADGAPLLVAHDDVEEHDLGVHPEDARAAAPSGGSGGRLAGGRPGGKSESGRARPFAGGAVRLLTAFSSSRGRPCGRAREGVDAGPFSRLQPARGPARSRSASARPAGPRVGPARGRRARRGLSGASRTASSSSAIPRSTWPVSKRARPRALWAAKRPGASGTASSA